MTPKHVDPNSLDMHAFADPPKAPNLLRALSKCIVVVQWLSYTLHMGMASVRLTIDFTPIP